MHLPAAIAKAAIADRADIKKRDRAIGVVKFEPPFERAAQKGRAAGFNRPSRRRHFDPQGLVGLTAHRAAAARIEKLISGRAQSRGTDDRAALNPRRQDKAGILAKAVIAAGIKGQADAVLGVAKSEKGFYLDIDQKSFRGIIGLVPPVPSKAHRQVDAAIKEITDRVAAFDIGIIQPHIGRQDGREDVIETHPQNAGIQGEIFFVEMIQIERDRAGGIGKGRGWAFQTNAQGIVGPRQLGRDVIDLKADSEPLAAAKHIAMQPVARDV